MQLAEEGINDVWKWNAKSLFKGNLLEKVVSYHSQTELQHMIENINGLTTHKMKVLLCRSYRILIHIFY